MWGPGLLVDNGAGRWCKNNALIGGIELIDVPLVFEENDTSIIIVY